MYLDVSAAKLEDLIQAAYALSSPRGLGYLHVKDGDLPEEDVKDLLSDIEHGVHMDYVHGRCCKFHVIIRGGRRYIPARWYDHYDHDVAELLKRCGIERVEVDDDFVYPPQAESIGD